MTQENEKLILEGKDNYGKTRQDFADRQADACYAEAVRRGNEDLYSRAWDKAAGK